MGRYLLYAVGEIVLVMIGILLALQVNNWNEERIRQQEERALLENLLEDLRAAREQSDGFIAEERKLVENLVLILGIHPEGRKFSPSALQEDEILDIIWDFESNVPVITSYAEIKNTGKASLISNRNIREMFTNLEIKLNQLNTLVKDRLTVQQLRIDDIAENRVNFVRYLNGSSSNLEIDLSGEAENDYKTLLEQPQVRNLLVIKLVLSKDVMSFREELRAEIEVLISLINSELENDEL